MLTKDHRGSSRRPNHQEKVQLVLIDLLSIVGFFILSYTQMPQLFIEVEAFVVCKLKNEIKDDFI